jgi:hypothetical protein
MQPYEVVSDNAPKIWDWLHTRGGIAVWENQLIGDRSSSSATTPVTHADGRPATSPSWKCPGPPWIITDPAEVVVVTDTILETVEIKVRLGSEGYLLKVTDASHRNMDRKVQKWRKKYPGKTIWWVATGDLTGPPTCLVLMESDRVPITEYMSKLATSN